MQVAMARRMYPLEYHGNEDQGKVLIQSKVEFDAGALQRLLMDVNKVATSFQSGESDGRAAGQESDELEGDSRMRRQLSWWKPARHKDSRRYHWTTNWPGEPEARIWLHVSDAGKGKALVYIRIESE